MADTVVVRDTIVIKDTTANPAPLGLFAFGMTTILLNCHNAGFFGLNTLILGMGIFFGGMAQVIAGIQEWKKNNTFGATAFTSFGCFWILLVFAVLGNSWFPANSFGLPNASNDPHAAFATFLVLWGLFTTGMLIGTFRLSIALVVVFGSLAVLFFLLAAGQYNTVTLKVAGYEGIFCGASACYTGLASVLNEVYGKTVLPIGSLAKK